jgi:hypothetical protein
MVAVDLVTGVCWSLATIAGAGLGQTSDRAPALSAFPPPRERLPLGFVELALKASGVVGVERRER